MRDPRTNAAVEALTSDQAHAADIQAEIERMKTALLGASARLAAETGRTINTAERMARRSRASRDDMRKVSPPRGLPAVRPATKPLDDMPQREGLTAKFRALR